jgi:hypothetical protein
MTSIALTVIGMIFVAYLGLALILYFMQPKFVYDPVLDIPYTPAELGLDFDEDVFRTGELLTPHLLSFTATATAATECISSIPSTS